MIKYDVRFIALVQILILICITLILFVTGKTFLDYLIGIVLCIANLILSGKGIDE